MHPDTDVVVIATSGVIGVFPTIIALKHGKRVALANKETLVSFGPVVKPLMRMGELIPVDSEHSGLFQLMEGRRGEIDRIVLTASGGPFRNFTEDEMSRITPEQALRHPTWSMGKKITIDSATLMNKGLEVIEAHFLFDLPPKKIKVVIHPQSIIHAMVYLRDSSVLAHLGYPDMKIPIQYALTYPERWETPVPRLNLVEVAELTFEEPDTTRFPLLKIAYYALKEGNAQPCVMNAANEVAVHAFLERKIRFLDIPILVQKTLELAKKEGIEGNSLESLLKADNWARNYTTTLINKIAP